MDYLKDLKADHDDAPASLPRGDARAGFGSETGGVVRDILPPSARQPRFRGRVAGSRKKAGMPMRPESAGPEAPPAGRPPTASETDAGVSVRRWEPDTMRRRRLRRAVVLAGFGAAIALAFILPTFVFPTYAVTLRPALRSVPVEAAIGADTERVSPDTALRRIPALLVSANERMSGEYEATGKKIISEKAQGAVLIFNAYSSSPQTLVASTRLQAPSGAVYRLRDTVLVPGAKIEEGKIVPTSHAAVAVADEPGEAANIGPTEFRIPGFRGSPKYQGFYAKAVEGLSGGFAGEAQVVTAGDLEKSSQDLTRRIVAKLREELKAKSPPQDDFLVPDGAREVLIVSIESPKAGERHRNFPVTVSARGRLLAVRRSHLAEVLAGLSAPPPPSGLTIQFPPTQPELVIRDARFGPQGDELTFTASGRLRYYEEPDIGELAATLRSSTPDKTEVYLKSRPEIESFRVKRFPAWLWFIPARPGGFRVTVEPPA